MTRAALAVGGLLVPTATNGQRISQQTRVGPDEVCRDFSAGRRPGLPWTFDDCLEVWANFEGTILYNPNHPEVEMWRDAALELRRKGSPCLLASDTYPDGLGSTTIRHLATWILAEEMGCDWVTPDWGYNAVPGQDGKVAGYCHSIVTNDDQRSLASARGSAGTKRCSKVNWLSYFQFDKPSVSWPDTGSIKIVRQASEVIQGAAFRKLSPVHCCGVCPMHNLWLCGPKSLMRPCGMSEPFRPFCVVLRLETGVVVCTSTRTLL